MRKVFGLARAAASLLVLAASASMLAGLSALAFQVGVSHERLAEAEAASAAADAALAAADAEAAQYTPVPRRMITPGGPKTGEATSDFQPPAADQVDQLVGVYFASQAEIGRICGVERIPGRQYAGCELKDGHKRPLIVAPNPCQHGDFYAPAWCHELGHAHGWPGDHAGGHFIAVQPYTVSADLDCQTGGRSLGAITFDATDIRSARQRARRHFARFGCSVAGRMGSWRVKDYVEIP